MKEGGEGRTKTVDCRVYSFTSSDHAQVTHQGLCAPGTLSQQNNVVARVPHHVPRFPIPCPLPSSFPHVRSAPVSARLPCLSTLPCPPLHPFILLILLLFLFLILFFLQVNVKCTSITKRGRGGGREGGGEESDRARERPNGRERRREREPTGASSSQAPRCYDRVCTFLRAHFAVG